MIARIGILIGLVGALGTAQPPAAQDAATWPALNERIERELDVGQGPQALSDALPAYRNLAREKYELAAIHACARNLAIINRAAQETVSLFSRSDEGGALIDAGAFYRSLTSLGRVSRFPSEGLAADEAKLLSLLERAMLHCCHQRVADAFGDGANPSRRNYLFAYLLATREPERADRMLDELPPALQTREVLHAFADYCASIDRRDMAGAVCIEGAKRSDDEAEASAFYNGAADYYLAVNDIGSAVEALRQIVSRFPESEKAPETQLRLIDLIADRWKSYGTAAKECQAFLEKFPESDKAEAIKLKIGHLYYQDKDYERAIQYFDALGKDPKMADMDVNRRFLLAFCYMGKGENEAAIDILDEIVAKHPQHPLAPRAQYVLAKTHLSRQEYAKAQEELKRLLALYPNSEYARQGDDLLQRLSRIHEKKAEDEKGQAGEAKKKEPERK